jgi:manganese efflux pump family protein
VPTAAASARGGALGIVTLVTWLSTAGIGAYMFGTMAARGGLRQQRAVRDGLPPGVLFGHFGLAITGLVVWVGYLATGWAALAWSAVGLLMPAFGLGICTVILWTPYPAPPSAASGGPLAGPGAGPAGGMLASPAEDVLTGRLTDEVLARALTDEVLARRLVEDVLARVAAGQSRSARRPRGHMAALVPFGHGLAAMATFVLAVVTAASTR